MTDADREALVERMAERIETEARFMGYRIPGRVARCLSSAALAEAEPVVRGWEREACAAWHDDQVAGEDALAKLALGMNDDDYRHHRHIGREHRHAAAAIRSGARGGA